MGAANELLALREGISAARAGNTDVARELLLRAAEIQPHNEQAWFWLAYIADNPKDRLSYLRRILRINPEQKQAQSVLKKALLQAGISAARSGDKSQARLLFLEIIELESANEQAWLWLASVSTTYKDVRHCLQRVLEINPSNQRAASWLSANRERPAASAPAWTCPLCGFASAVKASRCSRCKSVLTLGDVNLILENQDADRDLVSDAAEQYRKVAETNSTFGLHYTLGLAYLNLRKPDNALTHLRKALDLQPENRLLRSQIEALDRGISARLRESIENPIDPVAPAQSPNGNNSASVHPGSSVGPDSPAKDTRFEDIQESQVTRLPERATSIADFPARITDSPARIQFRPPVAADHSEDAAIRPSGYREYVPPEQRLERTHDDTGSEAPLLRPASPIQDVFGETHSQLGRSFASQSSTALQDPPAALTTPQVETRPAARLQQDAPPDVSDPYRPVLATHELSGDVKSGWIEPEPSPVHRMQQSTVLIVDDSPTVRKIVAVTLERQGYRVLAASGAIEALARINEALPDLILLDIAMPHMDGYQLCKLIKGNTLTKSVPVVMLSGKDGFFDKVRGRMTGATHYITKPFEPATLIEAVQKYCRRNGVV